MGLLDLFRTNKPLGADSYALAYKFCYQHISKCIFADPERVVKNFVVDGEDALTRLLASFFMELGIKPHRDFRSGCALHVTDISENKRAIVIQYPTPPTAQFELKPGIPLLPPYFSAIVFRRDTPSAVSYFVLGQAPDTGTTFRSVTQDLNANLGAGCAPELSVFVALLARRG